MASADIYYHDNNKRSKVLAEAAFCGVRRAGDTATLINSKAYSGRVGDYAVFYGLSGNNKRIFDDYNAAVHIDLGYFKRRMRSRYDGFHKVILNSRHPTKYFQDVEHGEDRFVRLGINLDKPQGPGNKIIVAGMSAKASRAEGIAHGQWERSVVDVIREYTDIPIHYRPKPNCMRSPAISGTIYDKQLNISDALNGCHAVVARQSNCCVDALVRGVPVYCEHGVASSVSMDIKDIAKPEFPANRDQFLFDLAYTQFNLHEIALGIPFMHMKAEGLL